MDLDENWRYADIDASLPKLVALVKAINKPLARDVKLRHVDRNAL